MTGTIATVCRSCPAGQAGFAGRLRDAAASAGMEVEIRETDCMSGCARSSTVAFRATGKTVYLFGEITERDIPDLLTFIGMYEVSPDGTFEDARPLGALREKAIARIPA